MCQTCKTVRLDLKERPELSRHWLLERIAEAMPRRPIGHFDALLDEVLGTAGAGPEVRERSRR